MDFFIQKSATRSTWSGLEKLAIKFFRKVFKRDIVPLPYKKEMFTIEQQINFIHLMNQVSKFSVEGDFVELGSFTGSTAVQFQKFIEERGIKKKLYLFDSFTRKYDQKLNIETELKKNFISHNLRLPLIIKGDFEFTLPAKLPNEISFVHIDCGFGGNVEKHKQVLLHCLNSIYPKLSKNGICILMDYYDPLKTLSGLNSNPGVKLACDEFFIDKSEKMNVLYGGYYSHGYFEKQ